MALEQNQQAVCRVKGFWSGNINTHEPMGYVVDREKWLYMITAQKENGYTNTISLFYKSQYIIL